MRGQAWSSPLRRDRWLVVESVERGTVYALELGLYADSARRVWLPDIDLEASFRRDARRDMSPYELDHVRVSGWHGDRVTSMRDLIDADSRTRLAEKAGEPTHA